EARIGNPKGRVAVAKTRSRPGARPITSAGGSLIYTVTFCSRHGAVRRPRRPSLLMYTTGRPLIGGSKEAKRILIHRCPSSDHRTGAIVWQTLDDTHVSWKKSRRYNGLRGHTTRRAYLRRFFPIQAHEKLKIAASGRIYHPNAKLGSSHPFDRH